MENLDLFNIVLFVATGFVAAFIDSTVGGGGLISVPALLTSGLPVSMVLGTNKLAASMGAVTSVISFWRSGNINKKLVISLVPMSMIGSLQLILTGIKNGAVFKAVPILASGQLPGRF